MTPRQKKLLKAVIDEFTETANAVGSLSLSNKYSIKASPATIRNEMAKLVTEGYLEKPHSSSGRVPTSQGIRYYLQELLEELDDIEYKHEAEMREVLFQNRFNRSELINEALAFLSKYTSNAAIAIINDHIYYFGLSEMLVQPEFQTLDSLKSILKLLENYKTLYTLFEKYKGDRDIKILIGEETGFAGFEKYAVIFTEISLHSGYTGYLAVIGANRMNYARVIPVFRSIANSIEDVVKEW